MIADCKTDREQEHPCQMLVLFDRTHLGAEPQACSSPHRWCLYRTPTGRAAGYCQELWKNHLNTTLAPSLHLSPWKPAFTFSSRTPLQSSFSPDRSQFSPLRNESCIFTSTGYAGDVVASDFEKMLLTKSFPVVSIYDERREGLTRSRVLEVSGLTDSDTQFETSVPSAGATKYKQVLWLQCQAFLSRIHLGLKSTIVYVQVSSFIL